MVYCRVKVYDVMYKLASLNYLNCNFHNLYKSVHCIKIVPVIHSSISFHKMNDSYVPVGLVLAISQLANGCLLSDLANTICHMWHSVR